MERHYLDYNATAPVRPEVAAVIAELHAMPLNASSVHAEGRHARSLIETSRRTIAEHIGVFPAEIVFTGSGTESNNWVLQAYADMPQVISAVEHSSILKAAVKPIVLPVDRDGVVDMAKLASALPGKEGFLVSVMLANNETGVVQPMADIAKIVHERGGMLHCDAAQALGKIPLDFTSLGCDLMTICAHKMGGPVGAAALVVRNGLAIPAQSIGGGQEMNRRAGTENTVAIAGFAEAVKRIDLAQMKVLGGWFDEFEKQAVEHGATIMGAGAERAPNVVYVAMPGMRAQTQMMLLDLEGISVSSGSACTSGKSSGSHVLAAMGVSDDLADCAIRVSGGWGTEKASLEAFSRKWATFRQKAPA